MNKKEKSDSILKAGDYSGLRKFNKCSLAFWVKARVGGYTWIGLESAIGGKGLKKKGL